MKLKLLITLFFIGTLLGNAQVIYSDEFDENINKLASTSSLSSVINSNNLEITGNGTSGSYQNLVYNFHNSGTNTTINASASPKIYVKIKAENSPTVRIDFVDKNGYSTSLHGLIATPSSEYQIFELNYTDRLIDGGYGGPCTSGPCNLDPTQLTQLSFYINPGTGGYTGKISIEWISIGESLEVEPDLNLKNAKVIGYLPDYRFSLSNEIDYTKLTHLMICFANPDASGNLQISDFSQVVADARAQNPNIKILLSLAGGGIENTQIANYWSNLIDIPANRPAFISKIVNYVNTHNFDGIDIDLEFDLVTPGYSDFVLELNTALDAHNKLITVAFPKVYYTHLTQTALEVFDFINLMAYDNAGLWSASPAQHSSFTFSEENINFWKTTGKISPEKLILGVPFYGHNFDANTFVTYGEMVQQNPNNANVDQIGNTFYNGIPTIENKVELAYNKVGGIMIWELGQDSFTENSLLTAIHEKYTDLNVTTTGLGSNSTTLSIEDNLNLGNLISIYPNPTEGILNIKSANKIKNIIVYNTQGKVVNVSKSKNLDLKILTRGLYFLKVITENNNIITKKVIKN
ncbi:glycosyl hydrolase family 18 protein [Polaribacter sp.]|uniref:glycosyl hydrolase family 18 protein n=1 Tax=Polaribacter sp. TaxID=1920175 RepID=UPI003F6DA4BD